MISNFKQKVIRDKRHLEFIRTLPCVKTGVIGVEAAHLRAGLPKWKKGGMGYKPCDSCVLPLSHEAHAMQHRIGEESFWGGYMGLKEAYELSQLLWLYTGQSDKAIEAIERFRR